MWSGFRVNDEVREENLWKLSKGGGKQKREERERERGMKSGEIEVRGEP